MEIDNIDYINSINSILFNFTTQNYDDILYDVYVCFSYEEVNKTFERIENNSLEVKPVIHYQLLPVNNSAKTYAREDTKVERNYFEYTIYIALNENYKSNISRYQVLNELSGKLKYKFDNNKDKIKNFHKININSSEGVLGETPSGLYASYQTLNFRNDKEVE